MYTKQALRELGVTSATLTDTQKKQLDKQGFFIVENVLSAAELAGMRAEFERIHGAEREQGGHEVHVEPGAPPLPQHAHRARARHDRRGAVLGLNSAVTYLGAMLGTCGAGLLYVAGGFPALGFAAAALLAGAALLARQVASARRGSAMVPVGTRWGMTQRRKSGTRSAMLVGPSDHEGVAWPRSTSTVWR